ncbi:MAG: FeoB-associated Cys-rich membrane protein [Ruminococcus sp.]|nr:FeoB-associated Cys-rich membrane protein [Ruminococcus sp.]MCM1382464.1 FeoB-associated Cys-rich membrane protein [Muribaculaceae bacterium]MCM1478510.1 FeoB-associated Cys-rich membrane protein [Muribaculaceae bacterium]
MATLIVGLIVAAVIFLAARQLWKDKKSGKSSCGGNCSCCPNVCSGCSVSCQSHGDVKHE